MSDLSPPESLRCEQKKDLHPIRVAQGDSVVVDILTRLDLNVSFKHSWTSPGLDFRNLMQG